MWQHRGMKLVKELQNKRAAEYGITFSLRFFAKKYPEMPLKETSVQQLKNLYQSEIKQ